MEHLALQLHSLQNVQKDTLYSVHVKQHKATGFLAALSALEHRTEPKVSSPDGVVRINTVVLLDLKRDKKGALKETLLTIKIHEGLRKGTPTAVPIVMDLPQLFRKCCGGGEAVSFVVRPARGSIRLRMGAAVVEDARAPATALGSLFSEAHRRARADGRGRSSIRSRGPSIERYGPSLNTRGSGGAGHCGAVWQRTPVALVAHGRGPGGRPGECRCARTARHGPVACVKRSVSCSHGGAWEGGAGGCVVGALTVCLSLQVQWGDGKNSQTTPATTSTTAERGTGDCPGPRKGATTRRNVTRGAW